jgi:hypothetical protein
MMIIYHDMIADARTRAVPSLMPLPENIAPDHGDEIAKEESLIQECTVDLCVCLGAVVTDETNEVLEGDISLIEEAEGTSGEGIAGSCFESGAEERHLSPAMEFGVGGEGIYGGVVNLCEDRRIGDADVPSSIPGSVDTTINCESQGIGDSESRCENPKVLRRKADAVLGAHGNAEFFL